MSEKRKKSLDDELAELEEELEDTDKFLAEQRSQKEQIQRLKARIRKY